MIIFAPIILFMVFGFAKYVNTLFTPNGVVGATSPCFVIFLNGFSHFVLVPLLEDHTTRGKYP